MWGNRGLAVGRHGKKREVEGQKPTPALMLKRKEIEKQREILHKYQMKQTTNLSASGKEDLRLERRTRLKYSGRTA